MITSQMASGCTFYHLLFTTFPNLEVIADVIAVTIGMALMT